MTLLPTDAAGWPADRLAEARAVIADVAHHRDYLIRLACGVLAAHGETLEEREEARRLLIVVEARTPLRLPGSCRGSKPDGLCWRRSHPALGA